MTVSANPWVNQIVGVAICAAVIIVSGRIKNGADLGACAVWLGIGWVFFSLGDMVADRDPTRAYIYAVLGAAVSLMAVRPGLRITLRLIAALRQGLF